MCRSPRLELRFAVNTNVGFLAAYRATSMPGVGRVGQAASGAEETLGSPLRILKRSVDKRLAPNSTAPLMRLLPNLGRQAPLRDFANPRISLEDQFTGPMRSFLKVRCIRGQDLPACDLLAEHPDRSHLWKLAP